MRVLPLCAALLIVVILVSEACADTRIFELGHRRAADVAGHVRAVLGVDARVSAAGQILVVSASAGELVTAAEVVARLDHPPRMLRIFVSQEHTQTDSATAFGASGRVSAGPVTIGAGHSSGGAPPAGGTLVYRDDGDHLRIDARSETYRETYSAEQFIVTTEGYPARISVGRRIPFSERWLVLARRHARVVESIRYESVDTGFEVEPELIGEAVQLDIRPYLVFQDPRHPREIRFQELAVNVRVPLGSWFELGGSMLGQDEVSREILATGNRQGRTGGSVRVRVELQPE